MYLFKIPSFFLVRRETKSCDAAENQPNNVLINFIKNFLALLKNLLFLFLGGFPLKDGL